MQKRLTVLMRTIFSFVVCLMACTKISQETGKTGLRFEIVDKDTRDPIPAKLIFVQEDKVEPNLQIGKELGICAEKNGFYTAFGKGVVEIPAGTYEVYASRGMEYSIDEKKVTITPDKVTAVSWKLKKEIDPQGFVACDFHLHTTNSDGRPTPEERVTSLIGEGLEFAAVTDHNFLTDLMPEVRRLDAEQWINICIGEEYTTDVGHYNVYPLRAGVTPFDDRVLDARMQFGFVHALQGPVVLQINHPRMEGLDYFGIFNVNPLTGETDNPQFSWDFDAMEVMNDTPGWGLFTGPGNRLSAWDDWINFLNKDFRPTAMGNTDTHTAISNPPGTPRNYVMSNAQMPSEINPVRIARNVIDHKVTVARGVFVNMIANDKYPVGSDLIVENGRVDLELQVMAPAWARPEKVTIYGNGRKVWDGEFEPDKKPLKYRRTVSLHPTVDTWYVAKVEGSASMWPIVPKFDFGEITPVGFTNPIWVDIDGNGFESERDRARKLMAKIGQDADKVTELAKNSDWIVQKQLYALSHKDSEAEHALVKAFAGAEEKSAREMAYSRLAQIGDEESISLLQKAKKSAPNEEERILASTYLALLGNCDQKIEFMKEVLATKDALLKAKQVKILAENRFVRSWQIIGPFPNVDDKGLETPYGPELKVDLKGTEVGKDSVKVSWQPAEATELGMINLKNYYANFEHSVAYAYAVIDAPEEMGTFLLLGSDDGAAVWHNEKQIFYRFVRRGAAPADDVVPVTLQKGENRFLVKVENGGSDWGFFFEVMDPCRKLQ